MWLFWVCTALLAAAAVALVIVRAAQAARRAAGTAEDPAFEVYRRQLAELDGEATRGGMDDEARRAARAEAGRRLLRFADAPGVARERPGGRASRLLVLSIMGLAAGLALGGYLLVGAPGLKDEPYAARLAGWRRADPATLDPLRLAAVLRSVAAARPHDPQALDYLGRAELAAGDGFDSARAFAAASVLRPLDPALYAARGQALVIDAQGKVTPEALMAFRETLRLDPKNDAARYFVGRAAIAGGDTAQGVADWKALAADLPPNDAHRADLIAEIDQAQAQGHAGVEAGASPGAPALQGPQAAFIHAMVARQAAELKARPDNPEGWTRLVRSYGVLGDTGDQARALAQARTQFASRPAVLAPIEAAAAGAPPR